MFKPLVHGRTKQVRLHPSVLVDPFICGLICLLALRAAARGLVRIAITERILRLSEAMALADAPEAAHRSVNHRFQSIRTALGKLGLLEPDRKIWRGRPKLSHFGDTETVEAVLNYGDNFIVARNPESLPHNLLLPLDVHAVSIGTMLHTAHVQAPDLLLEVMEEHRMLRDDSVETYGQWLHSVGLKGLTQVWQATH